MKKLKNKEFKVGTEFILNGIKWVVTRLEDRWIHYQPLDGEKVPYSIKSPVDLYSFMPNSNNWFESEIIK